MSQLATEIVLTGCAMLIGLPSVVLLLECVAASWGPGTMSAVEVAGATGRLSSEMDAKRSESPKRPSVDVLIPAHNEASVLGETLRSVNRQLTEDDRLCVVADNCNDDTANIARRYGAQVVERFDPEHRAKGFAVAKGLEYLDHESRDVLVMIDADCDVADGTIDQLATEAIRCDAPVQANYRMPAGNPNDSWSAVSSFAVTVKNQVRPQGLRSAGFGCQLTGSGMAFPSRLARLPNWATDNIVEDMKVSYDLLLAFHGPVYCPSAVVTARLPKDRGGALQQRKRWEHGHLQTLVTQSPRLLSSAFSLGRMELLVAALDLMIPPLSLLVQCWVAGLIMICLASYLLGTGWIPVAVIVATGFSLAIAMMIAWWGYGRDQIAISKLVGAPIYAFSKVPLYVTAVIDRQRSWIRTSREQDEAESCI